ncbi:CPBP family intramembrane glutamic endopeptidase [Halomonas rhizosphaerae]|uniref:CPBP family intramembrane metalloprotease n=1 Tax=Halomonas rhizosphaerae TaxID=3043296 RepID=A0ABT6V2C4_9GAMM|nr:CPBP family intramembrane glutamic endopeptidase [Halomonas rhizosphaerae]MDI5892374.1 CPBP family intramembrane metalloprotease [Halomonas rhizosphaerae]
MRERALLPFLVITFTIAWGVLAGYLFLNAPMSRAFGPITGHHPLFYLAVYAPAIAALLVVFHGEGAVGVRRLLARLLLWRASLGWYAFLLLGVPLVFYAAALLQGWRFGNPPDFASLSAWLVAALLMVIKGPVEELGWRGVALPLLQRRVTPFWAAILLGLIWGIWHLPAFFLGGTPQGAWSFLPFLVGALALSLIVTPMFNASRGSLLLPVLFHFQLINPLWPDAQPLENLLFLAVAVGVVWHHRQTMFCREGAVTAVVPK